MRRDNKHKKHWTHTQVACLGFLLLAPSIIKGESLHVRTGAGAGLFHAVQSDLSILARNTADRFRTVGGEFKRELQPNFHALLGVWSDGFLPNFRFDLTFDYLPERSQNTILRYDVTSYVFQIHARWLILPQPSVLNLFLGGSGGLVLASGDYEIKLPGEENLVAFRGTGFVFGAQMGVQWNMFAKASLVVAGGYQYGLVPKLSVKSSKGRVFSGIEPDYVLTLRVDGKGSELLTLNSTGWRVGATFLFDL